MALLDGLHVATEIHAHLKHYVDATRGRTRPPCLAAILVGSHPASELYVTKKMKGCAQLGIRSQLIALPESVPLPSLLHTLETLNQNPEIDGILLQLPLPQHLPISAIFPKISPEKDVDGFHPTNVGKLLLGEKDGFVPCTPLGIMTLLHFYGISLEGMHAVIVGRSNIVGKPTAALMMQPYSGANATVTIAHRHTRNLPELCREADVLVIAMGSPHFITPSFVKEGAIVVDVGINKIFDAQRTKPRLVGDVHFEQVAPHCSWISPVPGGVGPMTIAMLLQNTCLSHARRFALPISLFSPTAH